MLAAESTTVTCRLDCTLKSDDAVSQFVISRGRYSDFLLADSSQGIDRKYDAGFVRGYLFASGLLEVKSRLFEEW